MDGILLVDKPAGYTSHDIVAIVKRVFRLQKVGHTGTLDPLATGVLPLCINRATKLSGQFMNTDKVYEVGMKFGETTDTYDAGGKIVLTREIPNAVCKSLREFLPDFTGLLAQLPPPYSAVKREGKPLYWWARRGEVKEVAARPVHVYSMELLRCDSETARLRIACGKGTFVRSLVHEIGERLQCGAHVIALCRIQSGEFKLADTVSLDEITRASREALGRWLIPMSEFIPPSPAP